MKACETFEVRESADRMKSNCEYTDVASRVKDLVCRIMRCVKSVRCEGMTKVNGTMWKLVERCCCDQGLLSRRSVVVCSCSYS